MSISPLCKFVIVRRRLTKGFTSLVCCRQNRLVFCNGSSANKCTPDAKLADRAAHQDTFAVQEIIAVPFRDQQKPVREELSSPGPLVPGIIEKIRDDLTEAQRSRGELQARLIEATEVVKRLQSRLRTLDKQVIELHGERQVLSTRLKDRDEELRGKAKLLEHVHDETVSLTLQLNMAEAQSQTLKAENKELVDRWMARMGEEAEAMNIASKFS
ncbi:MAG: hypothetical protein Q9187_000079 [Circinaria calcarea]